MKHISSVLAAMLCLTLLFVPVAAASDVQPALTYNVTGKNITDEMDGIAVTDKFISFLGDNNINSDDYYLYLVEPKSGNNIVLLIDGTNKYYYEAVSGSSNNRVAVGASPYQFTIHNNCGRTVYYIGVTLYRWYGYAPINVHRIPRWNLPAGGTLTYNPDPDYTHVNLAFKFNKGEWFDTKKFQIPLGGWHHAYMCRNGNGNNYWSF